MSIPLKIGDEGAVTWWSAEQLRTWSNRPWNQDGKQLALVHHASVGVAVKSRDFTALSRWVGGHRGIPGVECGVVAHGDAAREAAQRGRTRAVHDAVTHAQQYAGALGLGGLRPVAVADAGMRGRSGSAVAELVPEHIEVAATVDARFVVEDG
jgi:uncharacterized protein YggE